MLPLTQRTTVQFGEDGRNVSVVILDAADDTAANLATAYGENQFTVDDIFWCAGDEAQIEVREAGNVTTYTGETFDHGGVLVDLDGVDPLWVKFEDLQDAPA